MMRAVPDWKPKGSATKLALALVDRGEMVPDIAKRESFQLQGLGTHLRLSNLSASPLLLSIVTRGGRWCPAVRNHTITRASE